ncbi:DnaD domain-containing protein [Cytobacillus gottheilii]|uniref:DnaD domain protein n=1 Tax=Cytobacillus gottheilii TaxID=859144 RepID=A0ABX8FA06_9BACI|nr:DnaD domain protein [Cytobacillus gottheilii]QVY60960.1 DnaD domain protein [Cytobacillus gottheilii]
MNYIKELNAFYDWLELNELSPSAINLWYALMHINNKAAWAETFTVAESVLCVKTGLTDRTLRKVRNELKQKNRIDFISRKGGRAPIYKLISFFSTENYSAPFIPTEINSAVSVTDSAEGCSVGSAGDSSALNKLKETKQNETIKTATATHANYFDEYMICFSGQPNPIQIQEINSFIDQDGLEVEVVCTAFRKAAEAGAKYAYARSILNRWAKQGVKSMSDVEREQEQHNQRKQQSNFSPRKGIRTEMVPGWFDDKQENNSNPKPVNDEEAKRAKMNDALKRLRGSG